MFLNINFKLEIVVGTEKMQKVVFFQQFKVTHTIIFSRPAAVNKLNIEIAMSEHSQNETDDLRNYVIKKWDMLLFADFAEIFLGLFDTRFDGWFVVIPVCRTDFPMLFDKLKRFQRA